MFYASYQAFFNIVLTMRAIEEEQEWNKKFKKGSIWESFHWWKEQMVRVPDL